MNAITGLTPTQLRKAADIQERILELQATLSELLGGAPVNEPTARFEASDAPSSLGGKKRRLSPQGLANILAGVAKRKAKALAAKGATGETGATEIRPKRKVSLAARRKMAASQAARRARERGEVVS
jgi:hypothetical protein